MSYLTGLFLAFSGLAFGYLLRSRERNHDSASNQMLAEENDDFRNSLRVAHHSNSDLTKRLAIQNNQMESIRQLSDEWSANHQQMQHEQNRLRSDVAAKMEQVTDLSQRLNTETRTCQALQDAADTTARQQADETKSLKTDWETKLLETESHLVLAQDELEIERKRNSGDLGLQNRIDNQESTIRAQRKIHEDEIRRLETELRHRPESDIQSAEQLAEVLDRNESLKSELNTTQSDLAEAKQQLDQSHSHTRELTTKVEELKATCQRISELENLVRRRDQEDRLVSDEFRDLREKYAAALFDQQQLQEKLNEALDAEDNVLSFNDAIAQRTREASLFDQEYGGPTIEHPVRGNVYTATPERNDDLKKISGIAEVLEARLNDYGVYTFKQILNWSPRVVDEFSRLLTFKNRIEHDDWVGQAKELYGKNDGRTQSSAA